MSEQPTQFPDEITVNVTEQDIREGVQASCVECPVTFAVKRCFPVGFDVVVGIEVIRIEQLGIPADLLSYGRYEVPQAARDFIRCFDTGSPSAPLTFTARRIAS